MNHANLDGALSPAFRFFAVFPRNNGERPLDRLHMLLQTAGAYTPGYRNTRFNVMFTPKFSYPIAMIGNEIVLR